MIETKCSNCTYFVITPDEVIASLHWDREFQHASVIKSEFEGECTNEYNWKPSRGNMPCDMDYRCSRFERWAGK